MTNEEFMTDLKELLKECEGDPWLHAEIGGALSVTWAVRQLIKKLEEE
jgi:hypothetical protein